jgi:hypothetical protein
VRLVTLLVLVAAAAVGAGVRVWQVGGRAGLAWSDTADFLAGSAAPWLSLELWAGERPPAAPVLLKVVGGDADAYVVWQAAIAVACWAALATSVFTVVAGRRARWLAALVVLGFSVTAPVAMWERSVLSESLAISLMALVVAAGLQVARGVTGWRVAGLLVALALWLATRDSHAAVALVGGAAVAAVATISWLRSFGRRRAESWDDAEERGGSELCDDPDVPGESEVADAGGSIAERRWLAALGLGAVALGLVVGLASSYGERHAFPMRNVYAVRVLPYADRVRWFADHGMPQADEFVGPDARAPYVEPGGPPVVYVADDDARLGQWLDWVGTDGRRAFAEFVATHPLYLVSEPLRSPERAFNNAHGDRQFYTPPDMPTVPLVDRMLALPTIVVLVIAEIVGGWAFGRRRWSPALVVGVVTAGLAVPHGLVAWHSDGMETARHLVVPAVQLHVGVLLMVLGTLRAEVDAPMSAGVPAEVVPRAGAARLAARDPRSPATSGVDDDLESSDHGHDAIEHPPRARQRRVRSANG